MQIPLYSMNQNDNFYQEELSRTLTQGLSDNGWTAPQQTSANIATISPSMPNGTFWYDTDLNALVINQNGTLVTVNTTPI